MIRIITTSGIDGWGECVDWLPTLHEGFQKRIIPYLAGKSVFDHLPIIHTIKKWHQRAAAAVSMALTEFSAKYSNLSICDLWGGKFRDNIPVYASFQSYTDSSEWMNISAERIEKSIIKGFKQIKVKIGGRSWKEDLAHIKLLQKLTEERISFMLDANQSYDLATARKWDRYVSKWPNIVWLEEPMPINNVPEYQQLRAAVSVPISGGENVKNAKQFLPLLRQNALDIIQPDILHVNGTEEFRDALKLARHFGIRVSPHSYDGSLSRLYTIFAQASLTPWSKMNGDNIEPIEWDVMENPFSDLIPIQPVNGQIQVPAGKGIGVELNKEIIKTYLWDGTAYQA